MDTTGPITIDPFFQLSSVKGVSFMPSQKAVRLSRSKALLCASVFIILTSIGFLGVSEAQFSDEMCPFEGIDPPFPPPKNIASELTMNPKRTLVFMETDETTGTKFSLVKVTGGLPGGIPCVGGVNWPRGYEVVGEVPADIDLTDDDIAKSLVNKGKAALFDFCSGASTTEALTVWLFKNGIPTHKSRDHEVYASWFRNLPGAPGPEIETQYHNKALERASNINGYPSNWDSWAHHHCSPSELFRKFCII